MSTPNRSAATPALIRCSICDKPSLTGTPGKCATCIERGAYETSCCGFAYADEPCTCATECQVCGEDRDGYEASPKDAKVVDPVGMCERCHESAVRAVRRERNVHDEHSDWLRSMRRADADYYTRGENWRGE